MYFSSFGLIYDYNSLLSNYPDWNPQIIDYKNEIGTYISTYKPKLTFKKNIN